MTIAPDPARLKHPRTEVKIPLVEFRGLDGHTAVCIRRSLYRSIFILPAGFHGITSLG